MMLGYYLSSRLAGSACVKESGAMVGVHRHDPPLLLCERVGFREDLWGNDDLADVVQAAGQFAPSSRLIVEAGMESDDSCPTSDCTRVFVRRLIALHLVLE